MAERPWRRGHGGGGIVDAIHSPRVRVNAARRPDVGGVSDPPANRHVGYLNDACSHGDFACGSHATKSMIVVGYPLTARDLRVPESTARTMRRHGGTCHPVVSGPETARVNPLAWSEVVPPSRGRLWIARHSWSPGCRPFWGWAGPTRQPRCANGHIKVVWRSLLCSNRHRSPDLLSVPLERGHE